MKMNSKFNQFEQLIVSTRKNISKMYSTTKERISNCLKIFEVIVNKKMQAVMMISRIISLNEIDNENKISQIVKMERINTSLSLESHPVDIQQIKIPIHESEYLKHIYEMRKEIEGNSIECSEIIHKLIETNHLTLSRWGCFPNLIELIIKLNNSQFEEIVFGIKKTMKSKSNDEEISTYENLLGLFYHSRVKYEEAVSLFLKSMETNNSNAMCNYAHCLYFGRGVEKNQKEAAKYYRLSANLQNASAMCEYAYWRYDVSEDFEEAAQYYKLAADCGNAYAMREYGVCLFLGFGVAVNANEAAQYYKKSAEYGDPIGMYQYGECLENGRGIAKNEETALRYYKMAADLGDLQGKRAYERLLKKTAKT